MDLKSSSSNFEVVTDSAINEQKEWIRSRLTKLWGEKEADYFLNTDLIESAPVKFDEKRNNHLVNKYNNRAKTGLYAQDIWDTVTDSIKQKKPTNIRKELKVISQQHKKFIPLLKKSINNS
jgi:hypothetical protein